MVITKKEIHEIENAVKKIEAKSNLEIVTVFLRRSDDYLYLRMSFCVLLSFGMYAFFSNHLWAVVTALISWAFLSIENFWSYWISSPERHHQVEGEAHRQFLLKEVFATKNRSGILILISYAEKSVYVLADKGIAKVLPEQEWKSLGMTLAEALRRQSVGETFLKAIAELESKIPSEHFQNKGQNPNELPDQLHRS